MLITNNLVIMLLAFCFAYSGWSIDQKTAAGWCNWWCWYCYTRPSLNLES